MALPWVQHHLNTFNLELMQMLVIHLCFAFEKLWAWSKDASYRTRGFRVNFHTRIEPQILQSRNCELKGNFRHFTIQFHEFQEPQWYKCWNHKFWVFSARKWQVQSHIYRVPPKRRPFFPVRTQVLTCPKMAVRKGREPRVRYWSRVYGGRQARLRPLLTLCFMKGSWVRFSSWLLISAKCHFYILFTIFYN